MTFDMICKERTFSCDRELWNHFRDLVVDSTRLFLDEECKKRENNIEYIEDEHYITILKNQDNHRSTDLIINALIHFNVGGLFALCFKNDNQGYYSIGNSFDICELLDNTFIQQKFIELDEDFYNKYYTQI